MDILIRTTGAIAAIHLILAGCTASTTNARPTPGSSVATAQVSTCLSATGSRIPVTGTECAGIGRSYSGEDMIRTGKTTVGGALPLLDPDITVQH